MSSPSKIAKQDAILNRQPGGHNYISGTCFAHKLLLCYERVDSDSVSLTFGGVAMWRFGYDTNASFILTIALISMLGTVLVWQKQRSGKTIHVWFWAAFFGILLGCAGTFALVRLTEGKLLRGTTPVAVTAESEASNSTGEHGVSGGPGDETGGEMGGGMAAGPGGGMGGGMGGFGGPRPKRDLTSTVRKVALLTGKIEIALSPDQASAFLAALKDIEQPETMTDEEAQAKQDALLALLDDEQKEQLEAIGLPRGPRPGGGPSERPAGDANPFTQETNSAALEALRKRFGGE